MISSGYNRLVGQSQVMAQLNANTLRPLLVQLRALYRCRAIGESFLITVSCSDTAPFPDSRRAQTRYYPIPPIPPSMTKPMGVPDIRTSSFTSDELSARSRWRAIPSLFDGVSSALDRYGVDPTRTSNKGTIRVSLGKRS